MFPSDCFLELSVVKQEADIAASEAAVLNPMLVANSEHICTRFPYAFRQTSTYLFALMSERMLLVQWTSDFESPGPNDEDGGNDSTAGDASGSSDRCGDSRVCEPNS